MDPEHISAIAAVAAAMVSVVAVAAAYRSASAAERSAKTAASALHRAAVRELIMLSHQVLAEEFRVNRIANDHRSEAMTLAVFSGGVGGSAEKELQAAVENGLAQVPALVAEAKSISENVSRLHAASAEDIDQMTARLGLSLVQLNAISESLDNQLSELRAQNQMHREKRING